MRYYLRASHLLAASALWITSQPALAADDCKTLLPTDGISRGPGPVTPEALARLRDIGPAPRPDRKRPLFTISPDSRFVAFQLHRADPGENRYCIGLVVLPLSPVARPKMLDTSTELIRDEPPRYGWAAFPIGSPAPVTPRWAPDGRWIAYLKRAGGRTQVWRASVSSNDARPVTRALVDVDDFRISSDGRAIIYVARPDLITRNAAIDREGLSGWRYDERAFPVRGARPQTPDAGRHYITMDIDSGLERPASSDEITDFKAPAYLGPDQIGYSVGLLGWDAYAEPTDKSVYPPSYRVIVERDAGRRQICPADLCQTDRSVSFWWSGDGKRLRFTRKEGWAGSLTAIYEWRPGSPTVQRLYLTGDDLIECEPLGNDLFCLREGSLAPRHFVKLGLGRNRDQKIFDPNPEFASLTLGTVERMNWRNSFGVPFYGDLVYPVGFKLGRRYPLIIVQYRTKGFLRGGIGDEVPIQAFANRGYFVLVVDNLTYEDIVGKQNSASALTAAFNRDFAGRRNILSAIEVATRSLIERGFVDPKRIGITGLSDGCTTVQYAAIHSTLFSAGSVSGCGWEPVQDAFLGPIVAQSYHDGGWPRLTDIDPSFWSQISVMAQPGHVQFPILFQAADNEYLAMVASHTALAQANVPSELYIFPDEDHIKWQPAHRLAVYRRNLAWFDFWLNGQRPTDTQGHSDVLRWEEMRKKYIRH
ncbi:Atxe2 family lasso peptide isopeptidase [Sphingobium sp. RAC03]|uniref:Atxe2 family lasso peptide isopeptidase n=1 Tax=Sphingobium sp. RAC03 TaxID=1843368 RepID=UPI00083E589F|nr:Atxe2 family lasso peptide isopeptidase [Sphingobium sp. RAC03]AOF95102.1 prolyl oligopeptidase family protein [Sphingobium sp. RAC03]